MIRDIENYNSMIDYFDINKEITKTINVELDNIKDKKLVITNNNNYKLSVWINMEYVEIFSQSGDSEVYYMELIGEGVSLKKRTAWFGDFVTELKDGINLLKLYNGKINLDLIKPIDLINKYFMDERNRFGEVYISGYSGETKKYCHIHCVVAYVAFPELVFMIIKKKNGGLQAWKITSERITTGFDLAKCAKIINKYITQKPEYVEVSEKLMSEIIASKV